MIQLRCAGCREAEGITVVSSMFGATSFALCDKCLKEGREDYRNMVNYISAAGHWPQDINEIYQAEVRRQLKLHGKTEEEFRDAVENAIAEEQMFMISIHNGTFEF
jgi:hypothetical protein